MRYLPSNSLLMPQPFPLLYQYCMLFISAESIPSRNHVRVVRLPSIHVVGATLFQFSYWMRFQCLYLHLSKSCIKDLVEIYRKYTRDRAYRQMTQRKIQCSKSLSFFVKSVNIAQTELGPYDKKVKIITCPSNILCNIFLVRFKNLLL